MQLLHLHAYHKKKFKQEQQQQRQNRMQQRGPKKSGSLEERLHEQQQQRRELREQALFKLAWACAVPLLCDALGPGAAVGELFDGGEVEGELKALVAEMVRVAAPGMEAFDFAMDLCAPAVCAVDEVRRLQILPARCTSPVLSTSSSQIG